MVDLICGLWNLDGAEARQETLQAMAAAMAPPDVPWLTATRCEGEIGLARLSIGRHAIPRPIASEPGAPVCVADARLFERERAIAALEPASRGLAGDHDEDVLRLAHTTRGDEAFRDLEGDYVAALWQPGPRQLTCVRDHVGARPLFYSFSPGRLFAFASLATGLTASGIVSDDLDIEAVLASFTLDQVDPERTHHKHVRRLPAGHTMVVRPDRVTRSCYWRLAARDPISAGESFEEHAVRLRGMVIDAIRRRLPKTGKVGAQMSGGLDSTSLSILAARELAREGRRLSTFTYVAEQRKDVEIEDERRPVRMVLQREPSIDNTMIPPAPLRFDAADQSLDDRVGSLSPDDPNVKAASLAAADDVDVILSGWGGDEVVSFNGRGALGEHLVRLKWRTFYRTAKAQIAERGWTWRGILGGEVAPYVLPQSWLAAVRGLRGREPDGMAGERLAEFMTPQGRLRFKRVGVPMRADVRANRLALFNSSLITHNLETLAYAGARHGVAFTYPLMDVRLMEYAIRMPAEFFMRNGYRRAIYRQAMDDVLPETIRLRHVALAPGSCILLRLAESKRAALEEIGKLKRDPRACEVFDFAKIEAAIRALPSIKSIKKAYNEEAAGGPTVSLQPVLAMLPIVFASYLVQRLDARERRSAVQAKPDDASAA